jgi:hypothetical protein
MLRWVDLLFYRLPELREHLQRPAVPVQVALEFLRHWLERQQPELLEGPEVSRLPEGAPVLPVALLRERTA